MSPKKNILLLFQGDSVFGLPPINRLYSRKNYQVKYCSLSEFSLRRQAKMSHNINSEIALKTIKEKIYCRWLIVYINSVLIPIDRLKPQKIDNL